MEERGMMEARRQQHCEDTLQPTKKEKPLKYTLFLKKIQLFNILFFSFGLAQWMLKFPGQGSDSSHSSDPSHCSDNARSLIHWATRELLQHFNCCCCCFDFLGLHPWHMEVPRPGMAWELQLPASDRATAMPDPSHICNLHTAHSNARSLTH